jgi:hypothetical protein
MTRPGLLALAVALAPAAAAAQEQQYDLDILARRSATSLQESPRSFLVEINGGLVRPAIENESGLGTSPYGAVFGTKKLFLIDAEFDWELYQGFGTFSLGVAAGWGTVYGHGVIASSCNPGPCQASADGTRLNTIPLRALAVYRFDWLPRQLGIPLVPFAKLGLAETIWWATNGSGSIPSFQGGHASGGKAGYELAAGLSFELNWLDPTIAREFDQDFGVNRVTINAQYVKLTADNFGGSGLDLSTHAWMFGLGFEF